MIQNNYSKKGFVKTCQNGCGKQIQWDSVQRAFIEVDTGKNHKCPNWNPQVKRLSEPAASIQNKIQVVDTSEKLLAEIYKIVTMLRNDVSSLLQRIEKEDSENL